MIGVGIHLLARRSGDEISNAMAGRNGFAVAILPGVNVWQDSAATVPVSAVSDPIGAITIPGTSTVVLQQTVLANRPLLGRIPKTGLRNRIINSDAPATQSVAVRNVAQTLSFRGTGTITLSDASTAGPLVGTGAGDIVSLTFTPSVGTLTLTVSGTVEIAQLEAGSTRSPYQRRTVAHDVTEAGVADCWGLAFDGVTATRHLVSPASINLSGSDKALFGAAFTKFSDAAQGGVFETGTGAVGSLSIYAPNNVNLTTMTTYGRSSDGSTAASGPYINNVPAPTSSALLADADYARPAGAEISVLQNNAPPVSQTYINGTQENTGVVGDLPAFVGSRRGLSSPFNGLVHALTLRGGSYTDADRDLFSWYMMQFTPGV